ncbi:hypothetical protein GO986_12585 [Deinococcus sp. HMF7620]|uniref:Type II restriction endonuclease EcoO109IR domain-containing protein n=1 Tax=Deinococcus arboris TaxID=2682977 RepID=A0A7C9M9C9_9DEIO|nr:PmeII family type II restriction endonuclease [Deinococcus arboris]MVN87603.1 hypothetical protein [Deinococcus arboris]
MDPLLSVEDPSLYDLLEGERPFYLDLVHIEATQGLAAKVNEAISRGLGTVGELAEQDISALPRLSPALKERLELAQKGVRHILANLASLLQNINLTSEEQKEVMYVVQSHHLLRPWLQLRQQIESLGIDLEQRSSIDRFVFREFFASKSFKFYLGRHKKIASLQIENFFPNPYLQAITVPVYGHKTFRDLIKSLIEAHLVAGQETAYGWMSEALISAFASRVVPGKPRGRQNETHRENPLKEIDAYFRSPSGEIDLISLKAGPMTINDSAAIEMRNKFKVLIEDFKRPFQERRYTQELTKDGSTIKSVIYGVTYGREVDLTNKPRIVKEGGAEVEIKVGKALWRHVSGYDDMYLVILEGLQEGYQRFEAMYGIDLPELLEAKIDEVSIAAKTRFGLQTTNLTDPEFWQQLARGVFEEIGSTP